MKKLVFILIFSLSLAACTKKQVDLFDDLPTEAENQQIEPVTNEEYQNQVKSILNPFWQNQNPQNIKQELLDLTVPKDYMDLHFGLVVSFQQLEQAGQDSNQDLAEEAIDDINSLAQQNPWLK